MIVKLTKKSRIKIIRFRKRGRKFYPIFDIILTYKDKRNRGVAIEKLGFLNPNVKERLFFINTYRLAYWLNKGVIINNKVKTYLLKFAVLYQIKETKENLL